jgi:hypothetical protein
MATDYVTDDLPRGRPGRPAATPRQIRLAKPEEGEARGEVFHLIRALMIVVGVTALIGWAVT